MSLFGPRLDRPSAVGDEGRPRATSLTIVAAVVLGLAAATFHVLGQIGLTTRVAFAAGLFVAGMALLRRQGVRHLTVGHFLFHAGAAVLVLVLDSGSGRLAADFLFGGLVLALLGLAATWANVLTREALADVTKAAPISYVAMLIALAVWSLLIQVGRALVHHLGYLFSTTDPSTSLFGFLNWVLIAAFVVRAAIWLVPLHELLPRRDRAELQDRLARVGRASLILGSAAIGTAFVASFVGTVAIDAVATSIPPVGLVLAVLSSPLVVGPLAIVAVVVALATVVALAANKAAAMLAGGNAELLSGALAGILSAMVLATLVFLIGSVPGGERFALGVGLLVAVALLASLLLLVACGLCMVAMDAGLVPDRAAGPALCAAGLLAAAIGSGLAGLPAPLIFGCVAGAVLVWDLSTFGQGLTVELGHRPDTRRLELYHGLLSVGVGVVAVVAATGFLWVRRTLGPGSGAWSAVALAVFGAMLLAFAASRQEA